MPTECAGRGIVKGSVGAVAVEEAVIDVAAVQVIPDDLARVVDAVRAGATYATGRGIIERGVGAVAVKEAMIDAAAV